jgi:hypothetical protein
MHRSFVVTRAVLALVGLLLVGPQKASADVVFACVNSTTGLLYVVSATTNCPPPSSGATWTKISWNTTAAAQPVGTNLLFPVAITNARFDLGITISNTSADPFNTPNQTGTCTLSFFSSGPTPATTVTPSIPPGTSVTVIASSIAFPATGYIVAACNFSYAHGLAFVDDQTNHQFSTYQPIVIQTPRPNGENLNN